MARLSNIFIETKSGRQLRAFMWRGDPQAGIRRAEIDARKFGYALARAWAEPIDNCPA